MSPVRRFNEIMDAAKELDIDVLNPSDEVLEEAFQSFICENQVRARSLVVDEGSLRKILLRRYDPDGEGRLRLHKLYVNYAHQRPPREHLRRKNEMKTNNKALRTAPNRAEPALKFFYHDPMERPRIPRTLNQPKLTASIGRSRARHSQAVSA
jgi:hypothetical protein